MDWDEPKSASGNDAVVGEVLERLSLEELSSRIELLKSEISRVEAEIEKRQAHQARADDVFKN